MGEDSTVNAENKRTEEGTNSEPTEDNAELVRQFYFSINMKKVQNIYVFSPRKIVYCKKN